MRQTATTFTRRAGALAIGAFLVTGATAAEAAIIDVTGATLGCFGAGCTIFTSPATSPPDFGLTFTGALFDVDTDASGAATGFSLGSFVRGNVNVSSSLPALPFTLEVTFALPSGITGGQEEEFSALINGTAPGGGGPLDVNFDNSWRLLTYVNAFGSGSFEFAVINDPRVEKNNSANPAIIFGGIRNATFTPTSDLPPSTAPEPASLMLFGAAVAASAWTRRRQRRT